MINGALKSLSPRVPWGRHSRSMSDLGDHGGYAGEESYVDYELWSQRTDAELEREDFARLNLMAAQGLRGAERLDIDAYCLKLDEWAELVRVATAKLLPKFRARPNEYGETPGRFRMLVMMTILQRDLGVKYDLSCSTGDVDYFDARPWFIHGPIDGRGGTCVSLPMLFLAVGRSLGYPLFLCEAYQHYFLRWEGAAPNCAKERFNIECTCQGFKPCDDEHFKSYPRPIPPLRLKQGYLLRNHTPREYLAALFLQRSQCLFDQWRFLPACEAATYAARLRSKHPGYKGTWATMTMALGPLRGLLPQIAAGHLPTKIDIEDSPTMEPWRRHHRPFVVEDINRLLRRLRRRPEDYGFRIVPIQSNVDPQA